MHHAQHAIKKHQINEANHQIQQKTVQKGTETKVLAHSEEEYVPATISNHSISNLTYV